MGFGAPLHSLVICGTTHPLEDELLKWHRVESESPPAEGGEIAEAAEGSTIVDVEAEGDERESSR